MDFYHLKRFFFVLPFFFRRLVWFCFHFAKNKSKPPFFPIFFPKPPFFRVFHLSFPIFFRGWTSQDLPMESLVSPLLSYDQVPPPEYHLGEFPPKTYTPGTNRKTHFFFRGFRRCTGEGFLTIFYLLDFFPHWWCSLQGVLSVDERFFVLKDTKKGQFSGLRGKLLVALFMNQFLVGYVSILLSGCSSWKRTPFVYTYFYIFIPTCKKRSNFEV